MERELGWKAEKNFESGIESTVRWYIDQKGWWQSILARGYVPTRVGLSQ
jgi:dTDP-glucose 4,6-dehydratase